MALSRIQTVVIVASVGAIFVSAGFARELYSNYQVDREIARLQARTQALEAERIHLGALKDQLASQDFLEGEARLKLGLKKPGETAIIIPEKGTETMALHSEHTEAGVAETDSTPLQRWIKHFFE